MIDSLIKPGFGAVLNREHPLGQLFLHSWLFHEGMGPTVHDLAGRSDGAFSSGSGIYGSKWGPGPRGYVITQDDSGTGTGSSVNVTSSDDGSGSYASYTILSRFYQNGSSGSVSTGPQIASIGASGVEVRVGGGFLNLTISGLANYGSSASAYTVNQYNDIAIAVNNPSSLISFFINGLPAGTASATPPAINGALIIGASGSGHLPNGSKIEYFHIAKGALTAEQIAEFTRNPYGMFLTPLTSRPVFLMGSSATAPKTFWYPDQCAMSSFNSMGI